MLKIICLLFFIGIPAHFIGLDVFISASTENTFNAIMSTLLFYTIVYWHIS